MLSKIAVWMISIYQRFLSPILPPACRFDPSCSEYSKISFERYGFFRGTWMTLKRILRCHPFNPGGYDPVP